MTPGPSPARLFTPHDNPAASRFPTPLRILSLFAVASVVLLLSLALGEPAEEGTVTGVPLAPEPAISYLAALSLAGSAASREPGGPWTLLYMEGYVASGASNAPGGICPFQSPAMRFWGGPLGIPPTSGRVESGLSPYWEFYFENATTAYPVLPTILLIDVIGGSAVPVAKGPTSCVDSGQEGLPAPSVDSSLAVATVIGSNLSFFMAHPALNLTITLQSGLELNGASYLDWYLEFTACSLGALVLTSASIDSPVVGYTASVNATSGASEYGFVVSQPCYSPSS